MKFFKTIDEKFADIGFVKVKEDRFGAIYIREDTQYKFMQRLDLMHKASGFHIVQSYDPALEDAKGIGNTCVGLTMYEMKLCLKKMKQMGWKPCKRKIERGITMPSELKPCKYCGGKPKLVRVGDQKEFFSFMCSSCFKHHAHYDEARVTPLGAARVWDRRADND